MSVIDLYDLTTGYNCPMYGNDGCPDGFGGLITGQISGTIEFTDSATLGCRSP